MKKLEFLKNTKALAAIAICCASACSPQRSINTRVPALAYADKVNAASPAAVRAKYTDVPTLTNANYRSATVKTAEMREGAGRAEGLQLDPEVPRPRARLSLVDGELREEPIPGDSAVAGLPGRQASEQIPYVVERASPELGMRPYQGPLAVGDPGVSASLWQESRFSNDLFRDNRAFQPMDLITIVVSETSEGKKEANTEVKQDSSLAASISNLLGWETTFAAQNKNIDLTNLVNAKTQSDFKGKGKTDRKGTLKGRLSAMVVEVLPSGILRIEGEKIISVNNEDETMVISGLVRPQDVSSSNEIDSSKIANVRIDYFGDGTVGDSQMGGWLGRIVRRLWPF